MRSWGIIGSPTTDATHEDYRAWVVAEHHHHCCPTHGDYLCPYVGICSILAGSKPAKFQCRECIIKRRKLDPKVVSKRLELTIKQIANKRAYRSKLAARPTNKTARGIK